MRAEAVGVDHVAPCGVDGCRPLPGGADTIAPVVLVRKAAAWPADIGHLQCAQCGHDVVADATGIGDGRIRSNPDTLVKSVSQVLRKLAEEVAIDLRTDG